MKHSYSRLSTYIRCPLAYKLQYVDKLPAEKSGPAMLGGICHDFFEAYDRHLAAVGLQTDHASADRLIEETFRQFERPLRPDLYEEYQQICRTFVSNHVLDLASFVGSEVKIAVTRALTVCDWEAEDVWFRFKLDRLDKVGDRAIITDYKTGWGGEADPFQGLLYACAIWILNTHTPILPETGDLNAVELVLYYNRSGRENKWVFTQDKITEGLRKMEEYAERLEHEKKWTPTPGAGCKGCAFAGTDHCRVKPSDIRLLRTNEDASNAAGELLLLEAQVKRRKEALKAWVGVNGPVQAQGDTYDFGTREKYEVINPLGFVRALEEAGYTPTDFYDVSTTELKKRCQRDQHLADLLAPFISIESRETFGHRSTAKRDPFLSPSDQKGDNHASKKTSPPSRAAVDAAVKLHTPGARKTTAIPNYSPARFRPDPRSRGGQDGSGLPDRTPGADYHEHGPARRGPARLPRPGRPPVGPGAPDPAGKRPGGDRRRPF